MCVFGVAHTIGTFPSLFHGPKSDRNIKASLFCITLSGQCTVYNHSRFLNKHLNLEKYKDAVSRIWPVDVTLLTAVLGHASHPKLWRACEPCLHAKCRLFACVWKCLPADLICGIWPDGQRFHNQCNHIITCLHKMRYSLCSCPGVLPYLAYKFPESLASWRWNSSTSLINRTSRWPWSCWHTSWRTGATPPACSWR